MKWNPKDTYNEILNRKRDYGNAKTDEERNEIAEDVKQYYNLLQENGYGTQAKKLSESDYDAANKYAAEQNAAWKEQKKLDMQKFNNMGELRKSLTDTYNRKYDKKLSDTDFEYDPDTGIVKVRGIQVDPNRISFNEYEDKNYITSDNALKLADEIARANGDTNTYGNVPVESFADNQFGSVRKYKDNAERYSKGFFAEGGYADEAQNNPLFRRYLGAIDSGANAAFDNRMEDYSAENNGNFNTYGAVKGNEAKGNMYMNFYQQLMNDNDSAFNKSRMMYNDSYNMGIGADNQKYTDLEREQALKFNEQNQYQNATGMVSPDLIKENNPYASLTNEQLMAAENGDFKQRINDIEAEIQNGINEGTLTAEQENALRKKLNMLKQGRVAKVTRNGLDYDISDELASIYSQPTESANQFRSTQDTAKYGYDTNLLGQQLAANAQSYAADKDAAAKMYGDELTYRLGQAKIQGDYNTAIDTQNLKNNGNLAVLQAKNDGSGSGKPLTASTLSSNAKSINKTFAEAYGGNVLVPGGLSGTYKLREDLKKDQKKELAKGIISSIYAASDLTADQKQQMVYAYGLDAYYTDVMDSLTGTGKNQ